MRFGLYGKKSDYWNKFRKAKNVVLKKGDASLMLAIGVMERILTEQKDGKKLAIHSQEGGGDVDESEVWRDGSYRSR